MKWTISRAAVEWGVHRQTLTIRLKSIGLDPRKGATFHTRDITRAVVGDLEQEKTIETRERRLALERTRIEDAADLVRMAEVDRLYSLTRRAIVQTFQTLPEIAAQVNPADPPHARQVLDEALKVLLNQVRAHLPER